MEWDLFPGRVLIGRPGVTYAQCRDREQLAAVVTKIHAAYRSAFIDPPYEYHFIIVRHDGRWAEQRVLLPGHDDDVAELERTLAFMRRCNEELNASSTSVAQAATDKMEVTP